MDQHVVIPLHDVDRGLRLRDVVDGGERLAHRKHAFGGLDLRTEGRLARGERADAVEAVVLVDPADEVGRRVEAGHGLDFAADATKAVGGLRVAGLAREREHQGEVPAGAAARDADLVGREAVGPGVGAGDADRPLDVRHDFVDVEARLRTVDDHEGRVAVFRPAAVADARVVGVPAAAHELDDRGAIGFRRLEDVHRQDEPVALLVDDVADAGDLGRRLGGSETEGEEEGEEGAHGVDHGTPLSAGSCGQAAQARNLMTTLSTVVGLPACTPGWWPSCGRKTVKKPGRRCSRVVGPAGWAYFATSLAAW